MRGFRFFSLLAVLMVCFLSYSQAEAARFSGAYLLQLCDLDENGKEKVKGGQIACQAYISGVIDYHDILQSLKLAPRVDICVPEKTTSKELQKIVLSYLHKNVTHDSFIAAPAVTMALYEVFPCKK